MKTKLTSLFILLLVALIATACVARASDAPQGEAKSVLTQEEATEMIDSALQALNTGDYARWSKDWDDTMKAAIKDSAFQDYRNQVISQYGQYVSLESVQIQPGINKGKVRWIAVANFEKGKLKYTFGFPNDSSKIGGLLSEAVK